MGGEMREDSVDDQEFDMLLNEIPHATSHNLYHHVDSHHHAYGVHGHGHGSSITQKSCSIFSGNGLYGMHDDDTLRYKCVSPASGFSLQSAGSSSSLLSGGCAFSDTGSPTSPPLEDLKSQMPYGSSISPNGFRMDSKFTDSPVRRKANESLVDELSLCRNLSTMYLSNGREDASNFNCCSMDQYGFQFSGSKGFDIANYGACHKFGKVAPDYTGLQSIEQVGASNFRGSPVDQYGFQFHGRSMSESLGVNVERHGAFHSFARTPTRCDAEMSTLLPGLQQDIRMGNSDSLFSQPNRCNVPMSSAFQKLNMQTFNNHQTGSVPFSLTNYMSRLANAYTSFCKEQGMNLNENRAHDMPISNGKIRTPSKVIGPQRGLEAFTDKDSFIIQGEDLNKGLDHARVQCKGSLHDIGMRKCVQRRSQLDNRPCENIHNARTYLPHRYNSVAEAQGYIYLVAKDQNGCRFLQRMFDEGSPRDVQIIFDEIIDHVAELMMNPFGNYLMQKLLDVCTEEQRMRILLMTTKQPGELIRISSNLHGTRVVQKLIETLKTRQQISIVISALEPGFHSLMIDVNGNHVIQRCLQCLSTSDNKFIFIAAAKYCVDIGTHQHGCCVLQRCISHSTGQYRENLVAEISANGLLLAQDSFGNYVVQFILELKIPSATSTLISQFEGNYVHLSTHRFSSHVVEKCLMVFNEKNRSRIIHELLSASHFERLLQDPHANYVVQTALRLSEGYLHSSLLEAIEAHRAVVRNSPYAKKIFSQKILKK